MCGICGAVAMEGQLDPAVAGALPAMTRALRHRGPDGEGLYRDERAALGHRRLAIIDRAGGTQPLSNEDGTCWVVFNGEIYNHQALRRQLLAKGHVFRTTSDTEVIVHAYEEYGVRCVERLEGMFAFAVHDRRTQEVFIARDRLGKKPLFYAALGGVLHFASEIKALARSPFWNDAIDLSGLEGYLSLGYLIAPNTIYRQVRKLEPGHWLRMANGRLEVRKYWDVERFDDDQRDERALGAEIDAAMREAVSVRLESEVPLGAFLSGGIDSGLVVSYMAEQPNRDVKTISVGFGDKGHNELDAAALTARQFQTDHRALLLEPRLDDVLDAIVGAFDEPFADSSAIPTSYLSAAARAHVTVALSGDGGDETFGGYDFRYIPHALEGRARRLLPGTVGRHSARWLAGQWPRSKALPRALRLGTVLDNLSRTPAEAYYADLCFLKPAGARGLLGLTPSRDVTDSAVYDAVTAPYLRCPSASPVQRAQYADLKVYLPNDVLVKVDRMSMLHGLEVRSPLLDRRIVELAFRIPTATKMPALKAKHLLKTLARTRLPERISTLPKHGFTAPVGDWIGRTHAGKFRADVLDNGRSLSTWFDMRLLRTMFDDHRSGRADHSHALWAVWMFARWHALRASAAQPPLARVS